MDPHVALATARRLVREHGLDGWTVRLDRAKTRAGVCRFARREIGLSSPLTRLHSTEEVLDTILHEIAHALVGPEHGHDAVWRARARQIGCSGERCVSQGSPTVRGDWVGTCPAGHTVARHRRPNGCARAAGARPGASTPRRSSSGPTAADAPRCSTSYRRELESIRAHYGEVDGARRPPPAVAGAGRPRFVGLPHR